LMHAEPGLRPPGGRQGKQQVQAQCGVHHGVGTSLVWTARTSIVKWCVKPVKTAAEGGMPSLIRLTSATRLRKNGFATSGDAVNAWGDFFRKIVDRAAARA